MDLLRFEDKDVGPIYVDGRARFLLSGKDGNTRMGVVLGGASALDFDLAGDVDEVAAAIERAFPQARIWRVESAA